MKLYEDDGTFIGDLSELVTVADDGSPKRFVISVRHRLSARQRDELRDAWRNVFEDSNASAIILEGGMTIKDFEASEAIA